MMESLVVLINQWMAGGLVLAALGSFAWGMVSVLFSPCHLASIPLIVGYVGGQQSILNSRQAMPYAIVFTTGLFITIAVVGVLCMLLGRMLGDVGPYWTLLLGALLLWVAGDMLGVASCSMPNAMGCFRLQGLGGAFVLGLAYGTLSGTCTFGFIAPLLAIIMVQGQTVTGLTLLLLFALGHCLPIVVAGSSAATVKRLLASGVLAGGSHWFRRGSGVLIGALGIYFLVRPWLGT